MPITLYGHIIEKLGKNIGSVMSLKDYTPLCILKVCLYVLFLCWQTYHSNTKLRKRL